MLLTSPAQQSVAALGVLPELLLNQVPRGQRVRLPRERAALVRAWLLQVSLLGKQLEYRLRIHRVLRGRGAGSGGMRWSLPGVPSRVRGPSVG